MNLAAGTDRCDRNRTHPLENGGTSDSECFVWLKQYCFIVFLINYQIHKHADFSTDATWCIFYSYGE